MTDGSAKRLASLAAVAIREIANRVESGNVHHTTIMGNISDGPIVSIGEPGCSMEYVVEVRIPEQARWVADA